MPDIFIRKVAD